MYSGPVVHLGEQWLLESYVPPPIQSENVHIHWHVRMVRVFYKFAKLLKVPVPFFGQLPVIGQCVQFVQ